MKFLLLIGVNFLITTSAFAHLNEGVDVHFFTEEDKSSQEFDIHAINLTNERVERGRRISNGRVRDCLAFTFDYTEDDGREVLQIAEAIKVKELGQELRLSNVKGTYVYFVDPRVFFVARFKISTLDGKTFTENFKRILGEKTVMNLSLE